ncbi:MAG: hypothetical protein AABW91_01165 [Nanoarchaeota archaeon]
MELNECWKKKYIRKVEVNIPLARSLIEMSGVNENSVNTAVIDEENISSYVYLAYESLREVLEAISLLKGCKVLNHICLGELLNELLDDFDFNSFDRFRYIRNGIGYYGRKVGYGEGKEIITKIFSMKKLLYDKYIINLLK